jgi:hypothetical protein
MKSFRVLVTGASLSLLLAGVAQGQTAPTTPAPPMAVPEAQRGVNRITGAAVDADFEEEYAYALGVQAYVHLFPWYYGSLLRWRWATVPQKNLSPVLAEPNTLAHQRQLIDASYKDGGRPNNDTLYSVAWVDLSREPVIIHVPDMGKRYYSIELAGFDADNFDYIGTRVTGNRAGTYAVVGPDWKGTLPKGVKARSPAQTRWIFALVRILVDGTDDLPAVHALQDKIVLQPLSAYLGRPAAAPKYVPQPPFDRRSDPLADWKSINRALAESPMPASEGQLAKAYAQIGIGPGIDVDQVSPAVRRGLIRARDAGAMIVTSAPAHNVGRAEVNGWGYTSSDWGSLATNGRYLMRASKSLGGIVAHDSEECLYGIALKDSEGRPLDDAHRYELRFGKGQLPPVNAFWSITLYGADFNFVDNPLSRYAIGDRTKGVRLGDDGSLTIYIQKDPPGGDKDSNWLPSGGGRIQLAMRAYLPRPEALDGRWQLPAVRRVD